MTHTNRRAETIAGVRFLCLCSCPYADTKSHHLLLYICVHIYVQMCVLMCK